MCFSLSPPEIRVITKKKKTLEKTLTIAKLAEKFLSQFA